ncbi:uncharacterized protein K452DRAFT_257240 [Aplosporella prunicola CBS 121167]|uniref:Heterokaryon incompatibility domain-containing protein n=1 Tax=Aplosporella prunicola CBS 121167 TaxID=1176127 RepID=A0A6A6B0R4_9PEZI|nr:uncharacterized protein K452DRAFT_257240 [Aplosporella prunicola CBS 121167]KAF2137772.1 hypothetical protein K452DRAFT_257240 [Aplosporella prunicola CBS 121167]
MLDLEIGNGSPPGLAIIADPGVKEVPQDIRIGFPVLPEVGGATHFALLREWLRACNEKKGCYQAPIQLPPLPKRLLDVGGQNLLLKEINSQEERIPLDSTSEDRRYIALSHRWGDPTEDEKAKFCTYACNIKERTEGINFDNLPKTFRDAVTVARELGIRYLWIDSMCIMQAHEKCADGNCGPGSGDWATEAEKMEQYFGSAYCTVAADSAKGPNDGLFQSRQARQCVRIPNQEGSTVYLCKGIDNFDHDVDKGVLNQRGWVFQERALSCRTIHYTNTQTYWECGCRIRCETLGALKPPLRYSLHEPRFPRPNALTRYAGQEILKFAFQQYSKLSLTRCSDRPIAISGVVNRFVKCLDSREICGIFEKYLHQSLLWRRTVKGKMRRIAETQTPMPSWSWMAYEGEIEYIDIGDGFIGSQIPFPSAESSRSSTGLDMELREPVRGLKWEDTNEDEQQLTFDGENPNKDNKICAQELKLAIVGCTSLSGERGFWVYVLIVRPCSAGSTYERVGAGRILERYMNDVLGVTVRVH